MDFKYNDEYLKQLCEKKDLEFVGVSYKVFDKKRRCVDFICNKHRNWGVQTRPVEKLVYKQPCQYCNHKILKKNFKEEVAKINPNIEVLGEYTNSDNHIKCRCVIHDYKWSPIARELLYGEGCPICGKEKRWDSRGRITTEIFKQRMNSINPDIEIIGEYTRTHQLIRCRCKIHNIEWESYACNIQNQTAQCPQCSEERKKNARLLSDDEILLRLHQKAPHIEIVSKYQGIHSLMTFRCVEHNEIFQTYISTFLWKNGRGCPICSQSLGERHLCDLLKAKDRKIETQYIFEDCVYKKPLRFDVYDTENNIAYEYQGQQHYYPVDFDGDKEKAQQEFKTGLIRDAIKEQYCKDHNIMLIKIPYWDFDKMDEYIV